MIPQFNKKEPYGHIIGPNNAVFEQDGVMFDGQGNLAIAAITGYDQVLIDWQWQRLCYLVVGNVNSCTRLLVRILCSNGDVCLFRTNSNGNALFEQLGDENCFQECEHNKIAFKYDAGNISITPTLEDFSRKIRNGGFSIYWIFLIRRPSRYELRGYPSTLHEFLKNVKPMNDRYTIWDSSLMFLDPDNYLAEMGQVLRLDLSNAEKIYNADEKWIKANATTC